jgi:XRE family aerobic/anaerobic benzoate catabolism transcriptional regulator
MMADYYEPYPRWRISRAVVVAGQLGCGAAAIARNVAARTGLPFVDLDRSIEHEAGRSLARIAFDEGREGVARRAESILDEVVGRSPRGLVALGRAWPPPSAGWMLMKRSYFIHIDRTYDYIAKRIQREFVRAGDWLFDGMPLPSGEPDGLRPLFAERDALLANAGIVLDAGDQHVHDVAEVLLDSLEDAAGAERL